MKGYVREKMREITADRSALRKCRNAVSAGVLSPISSAVGRNGAVGDRESARAGGRRPGGEQVLRLRARDGAFRAPARVTFFFCKKKVTKENRLDLRSKGPLARCGLCKIGGADLAELVRRGTLSVRGIACTSCAAAADSSEGRGWCAGRFWRLSNRAHCGAKHRNG